MSGGVRCRGKVVAKCYSCNRAGLCTAHTDGLCVPCQEGEEVEGELTIAEGDELLPLGLHPVSSRELFEAMCNARGMPASVARLPMPWATPSTRNARWLFPPGANIDHIAQCRPHWPPPQSLLPMVVAFNTGCIPPLLPLQ